MSSKVSPLIGPDFRVSDTAALADEGLPGVASNNAAGEYLVVWGDGRSEATRGSDVFGRRVGADGAPIGSDFRVSGAGATADDWAPKLAWNATSSEYLVVWRDERNEATRKSDIYGRRVSAAGVPIGSDFRITGPGGTADEYSPAVAWSQTANEYLVVWTDDRSKETRGRDIYGRRVSAAGVPTGRDFRISGPGGTADEKSAGVAWDGTASQYLVVWADGRDDSARGDDIWGRRVAADGSRIGRDRRLCGAGATTDDWLPGIAANGGGEFLIVWQDGRNEGSRGVDVYGRRIGTDGRPVGRDFRISGPAATDREQLPRVAYDAASSQYLVVWDDGRALVSGGAQNPYGRRLGADGSRIGRDFRISRLTLTSWELGPAVAWNSTADQFLVVWESDRNVATSGWDIYGRRVTG